MILTDMKDYIPSPESLRQNELAYNIIDDSLSLKVANDTVIPILKNEDIYKDIAQKSDKIERGGNANGKWTKFPDGFMIQWGDAILEKSGTHTHLAIFKKAYPISFYNYFPTPSATLAAAPSGIDGRNNGVMVISESTTQIYGQIIATTTQDMSALFGLKVRWSAIGRWK